MNRNISPPLVILLDMLFIFLFVLILNTDVTIDVVLPGKKLFDEATLVYSDGEKYVDIEKNEPPTYTSLLIECGDQLECKKARKIHKNKKIYVYLPERTFSYLSEITLIALEPGFCKSLKFTIDDNGDVDDSALRADNKCLSKISGF